jgi:hypothetical protein
MSRIIRMAWRTGALLLLLCTAASRSDANTLYAVNRSVGFLTVTGVIETDGTIGPLSSANLVSWNLVIDANASTPPFGTDTVSSLNSVVTNFGGLSATASSLLFDFSGLSAVVFERLGADVSSWCLDGVLEACSGSAEAIKFRSTIEYFEDRTGVQTVATAIPEPASSTLLAGGALGLLASRRVRRARG